MDTAKCRIQNIPNSSLAASDNAFWRPGGVKNEIEFDIVNAID